MKTNSTFMPPNHFFYIFGIFFFLLLLSSCSEDRPAPFTGGNCVSCHQLVLDEPHQIPCITCHAGNDKSRKKDVAHFQMIRQPAHPDNMANICGSCHETMINEVTHSLHFTLENSTNIFRKSFGATTDLKTFLDTPKTTNPDSVLELADDLLRRRCFRCHPYTKGDDYPAVTRGAGCASCHLPFFEGKMTSHLFQPPKDNQCLSCHYGNYVGFDYYGRFEHDFNEEYRTPYTSSEKQPRPFGVEYHQLKADIHQQKGMVCIDCHTGRELMNEPDKQQIVSCAGCHLASRLNLSLPDRITKVDQEFFLLSGSGKRHSVPIIKNRAHFNSTEKISCQACHAQWTFADYGVNFLRSDLDDFDPWYLLATQGDSELEIILKNNWDFDNTELPPLMSDKITGTKQQGLWYKGYTMRRWENVILGRDSDGTITTVRPILDFALSWIDEDEEVRFDAVAPGAIKNKFLPYTPHTTGPAGIFYTERIRLFIESEKEAKLD